MYLFIHVKYFSRIAFLYARSSSKASVLSKSEMVASLSWKESDNRSSDE